MKFSCHRVPLHFWLWCYTSFVIVLLYLYDLNVKAYTLVRDSYFKCQLFVFDWTLWFDCQCMYVYRIGVFVTADSFWENGANISVNELLLLNCCLDNNWMKHGIIYSSLNFESIRLTRVCHLTFQKVSVLKRKVSVLVLPWSLNGQSREKWKGITSVSCRTNFKTSRSWNKCFSLVYVPVWNCRLQAWVPLQKPINSPESPEW